MMCEALVKTVIPEAVMLAKAENPREFICRNLIDRYSIRDKAVGLGDHKSTHTLNLETGNIPWHITEYFQSHVLIVDVFMFVARSGDFGCSSCPNLNLKRTTV